VVWGAWSYSKVPTDAQGRSRSTDNTGSPKRPDRTCRSYSAQPGSTTGGHQPLPASVAAELAAAGPDHHEVAPDRARHPYALLAFGPRVDHGARTR
jgi:hypothetical protein